MSESNTYYIKQVWRKKGDALFDRISFKEANKAQELSQTTRPVLLLETKANGGSNAVFAIGRVSEPVVIEEEMTYPGQTGEFFYHVPFTYTVALENKQDGITREELQELTGQKFTPQVKGGLYEIGESEYQQLAALLNERGAQASLPADQAVQAEQPLAKADVAQQAVTAAQPDRKADARLLAALNGAVSLLQERPDLRLVIAAGKVDAYPAALRQDDDLDRLQAAIGEYLRGAGHAELDAAAREAAAAGDSSTRYLNVIKLVAKLVGEGKYSSVQIPAAQAAFASTASLPHPYDAIELSGDLGHHVLSLDGTLYSTEGKVIQHFLGL